MKIKDILGRLVTLKLSKVAFENPKKNMDVWKFLKSILMVFDFLDAEKDKRGLLKLNPDNQKEFDKFCIELLEWDLPCELPILGLTEQDFENCAFSSNKEEWLSAMEIDRIIRFCKMQNEFMNKKEKEEKVG